MTRATAFRRRLAVVVFVAVAVAGVPWRLLQFVAQRGLSLPAVLQQSVDRRLPGYSDFILEVRTRTKPGEKITIAVPGNTWDDYSFAYYRASYLLAGREVLPLIAPDSRPVAQHWRDAQVVAIYGMPVAPNAPHVAWRGKGGAIVRR